MILLYHIMKNPRTWGIAFSIPFETVATHCAPTLYATFQRQPPKPPKAIKVKGANAGNN